MSGFGLRSGGFTGASLNPFGSNTGGFGQYELGGNDGAAFDALKRDTARVQWANGAITDAQYVAVLHWYAGQQESGTVAALNAKSDYEDAVYSIDRNKIVRDVNASTDNQARVRNLSRLIAFDERRLHASKADNEQTREIQTRISDAEAQIRDARYGDAVRSYNRTGDTAAMQAVIRRMAASSRGATDHQTWVDRIGEWAGRKFEEDYAAAVKAYNAKPSLGAGAAMVNLIQKRMGDVPQESTNYDELVTRLADVRTSVDQDHWNAQQTDMQNKQAAGTVSDEAYITFLHERLSHEKSRGNTTALQQAKDNLLGETYRIGQARMESKYQDDPSAQNAADLISFYQGFSVTMNLGAEKWRTIQDRILQLRLAGVGDIPSNASVQALGGHWVTPGHPGSSDVGFASQFDGSEFANQNCMFASGAMMADALGLDGLSGADLRRYSGDGAEGGAGFQHMLATAYGSLGLGLRTENGVSFSRFERELAKSGGGAVVAGLIASLPEQYRISGSGAHSIYVTTQTKKIGGTLYHWVMDPLGRGGYNGQWWPAEVLQAFGWSGARNPISGNEIFGSVMFGNRTGRTTGTSYRTPHFQAFDTDAKGNSTLKKGGGSNRDEAGPPTDWRKGRVDKTPAEKGGAKDPSDVQKFVAALDHWSKLQGDEVADPSTRSAADQKHLETSAAAVLAKYKGNARLAAIDWFYGDANTDTAQWTSSQRAIANSVGGAMGYPIVPPEGIGVIIPGEKQARAADATGNVLPQGDPGNPKRAGQVSGPTNPTPGSPVRHDLNPGVSVAETDPAYAEMARSILHQAGVSSVTPSILRAMVAWMKQDTGDKVEGNNPFGLKTTGNTDLPGQIGKAPDGTAIFGSVQDGVDAAARHIANDFPDIVAAANSGQPGVFLDAVGKSTWQPGGYGDSLYKSYNKQTGTSTLIGGTSGSFDNSTFGKMAGNSPELADLAHLDPNDPAQMAVLDGAIDSAKYAYDHGLAKWDFVTSSGRTVSLTFNPEMYAELGLMKAGYKDAVASASLDPVSRAKAHTDAIDARNTAMAVTGRIAMDQYDDQVKSLDGLRQTALASGDWPTYVNATLARLDAARQMLGQAPGDYSGTTNNQNQTLSKADLSKLQNDYDQLDPGTPDQPNPGGGDPILAMALDPNSGLTLQRGKDGSVVAVTVSPDDIFVTQDAKGNMVMHTRQREPDQFEPPIVQYDKMTGKPIGEVPPWAANSVQVDLGNGYTFRVFPQQGQAVGAQVDYAGYRAPVATHQPSSTPGSMLPTDWASNTSGAFDPNLVYRAGDPAAGAPTTIPPARDTRDGLVTVRVGGIPVRFISYIDPSTHRVVEGYSADGVTWATRMRDPLVSTPPVFVLNQDSKIKISGPPDAPVFTDENGKNVDMSDPKIISKNFHFKGDPSHPEDQPNPDAPPQQPDWKVQVGKPAIGGSVQLDTGPDTSLRGQFGRAQSDIRHTGSVADVTNAMGNLTYLTANVRKLTEAEKAARIAASTPPSHVYNIHGTRVYGYGSSPAPLPATSNMVTPNVVSFAVPSVNGWGVAAVIVSQAGAARQASIDANARASAAIRARAEAQREAQATLRRRAQPTVRPGLGARVGDPLSPAKMKENTTPTVIRRSGFVPRPTTKPPPVATPRGQGRSGPI